MELAAAMWKYVNLIAYAYLSHIEQADKRLLRIAMSPEDIPLGYYTHINFAFSLIDPPTYRLAPMDDTTGTLYNRVTALKQRSNGLEVWLAVGGWSMNDPGATRTLFSDLAGSESAQAEFLESLMSVLLTNGFDGVDIDWYVCSFFVQRLSVLPNYCTD